jgi:hypothetical protein
VVAHGQLSLHDAAGVLGGHVWTERRLFEVLGASAADLRVPAAKAMVDRHAAHAAWRAGQWWDRLPVLAVIDRDALILPPSPGIASVYDRLAGAGAGAGAGEADGDGDEDGAAGDDAARLAGLYRVALPRLAVAYRVHAARTAEAADGAVRRTLERSGPDLEADRAEGEALLQSLLVDIAAVDAAATRVAALERLLVAG